MTRETFIECIEAIQKQYEHDVLFAKNLSICFPESFYPNLLPNNHFLQNALLSVLQIEMNDNILHHSWIEHFMYELDFGKKNKELQAKRSDGSEIDLSDAGKLYDFLNELP